MSQASDSSQNYHNIITNLLNFKKQWLQVPQVIYLTIKAIYNHGEQLEQTLYQQRELITEQSVKLKEIGIEVEELLRRYRSRDDGLAGLSGMKMRESGFKKRKKGMESSYEQRSKSNRRKNQESSPQTIRQERSISFDQGLDKTMVQEVKALTQAIVDQKNKSLQQQIAGLKEQLTKKTDFAKINQQLRQQISQKCRQLTQKISQTDTSLTRKLQSDRTIFMTYAQETSTQIQKIFVQLNNINIRISELAQQNKACYSNPIYLREDKNNTNGQANQKEKEHPDLGNARLMEKIGNLGKEFGEFKMKILREMGLMMKSDAVESIVSRFQAETSQKITKINNSLNGLSKVVDGIKRDGLIKNQSKGVLMSKKVLQQEPKRDKNSQKSLSIIQQSLQRLESHFKQKLKSTKKQLITLMETTIERQQINLKKDLRQELQVREKTLCQVVQSTCDKLNKPDQKQPSFSDSSLRKVVNSLSQQMILSRYLHLGEKNSKDVIQWQKNVHNSMEQNFIWKPNSHCITVMAPGLYRLEAGLYADNETDEIEAYIVLNGTPISELANKKVPPNSLAPSRGSLFNEAVLLPSKSKLWIKPQTQFFGQAYLQILKL